MSRLWLLLLVLVAGSASAAIDTRDKRASAINSGSVTLLLPNPDGAISASDRAMLAGEYSGLAAADASPGFGQGQRNRIGIGIGIGI